MVGSAWYLVKSSIFPVSFVSIVAIFCSACSGPNEEDRGGLSADDPGTSEESGGDQELSEAQRGESSLDKFAFVFAIRFVLIQQMIWSYQPAFY